MTQVNSVYLFVKNWNNRWYYPGICLECDNGENVFFSEKTNFFKKRNGQNVFPPQTVTDLSVRPKAERWDIPDGQCLYAEHVLELYEAEADYHSFAEIVKKALEFFHGLHYGQKNILVTQGVKTRKRCVAAEREAKAAEREQAYLASVRQRRAQVAPQPAAQASAEPDAEPDAQAARPDAQELNQLLRQLRQYLNVENPQERLQELLNGFQGGAAAAQG